MRIAPWNLCELLGREIIVGVDEYLAGLVPAQRAVVEQVRAVIARVVPLAQERMSYAMPSFWQGETLIWYAATKRHLGIYPTASGVDRFADRLTGYDTSRGTIRIPWDQPIPYDLIGEIAAFRAGQIVAGHSQRQSKGCCPECSAAVMTD
ncbi:MAG: DUF1801 domain-containing protein [Propionibacteriaceae bacterium]|nr:DUF1801 domain-containing protein [Propionibacteriaceae bacterium]